MKPFEFKFSIEGELDPMAKQDVSFTVTVKPVTPPPPPPPTPLTVTTSAGDNPTAPVALPDETVGTAVNDLVCMVHGGVQPYNFAVTAGSLPPGTNLMSTVSADGLTESITLQGNPTTPGSGQFTLEITDSATPPAVATVTKTIA